MIWEQATRQKARDLYSQVDKLQACSVYCRSAVICNVAVHSNMEIFKNVSQNLDYKAHVVALIINSQILNSEEEAEVRAIDEIFGGLSSSK